MRAMTIANPGENSTLELTDRDDPECGTHDVIVKVAAVGVNNVALMARRGFFCAEPFISGQDIAGTIMQTGSATTQWQIGALVFLNPAVRHATWKQPPSLRVGRQCPLFR